MILGDPDPLARRAMRAALQEEREFVVAAEAANGVELVELCLHYRPELALVEPELPQLEGLEAVRVLAARAPEVRVVLYSRHEDPVVQVRALRHGACGCLSKQLEMDAVVQALRGVLRGEAAVSRDLTMRLIEHLRAVPEPGRGMRPVQSVLTTREWEVLDLLISGASTREIAARLVLTQDTIYSHVKNILRKLGVRDRAEAIEVAEQMRDAAALAS